MRAPSQLALLACIACLASDPAAAAGEAWTLQSRDGQNGKTCSLSTTDRGRPFAISLSFPSPAADQGIVGISFDDPKVIRAGAKTLATLELDDGTRRNHRLEAMADGSSLIPVVTSNVQDVLQDLSKSGQLGITTRFGSTSFSLDGIGDHVADLRRCASQ